AQRAEARPGAVFFATFGHGALLRSGNASWSVAFPDAILFIGVRFASFSASLKVLLHCAKTWQLPCPALIPGPRQYRSPCRRHRCGEEQKPAPFLLGASERSAKLVVKISWMSA